MKRQARSRGGTVTTNAKRGARKKGEATATSRRKPPQNFFTSLTIDELAEMQGVKPLRDPSVLAGAWPEDEDLNLFLEETYRNRHA